MEVVPYGDAARFREDFLPHLMAEEVRHNLMLGLLHTLVTEPDVYPEFGLWGVRSAGTPVAAALRTPPYKLVLSDLPDRETAATLARFLADRPLPGSVGVLPGGEWFPDAFAAEAGVGTEVTMRQGIFSLTRVEPVPSPGGGARAAGPADAPLVVRWVTDFSREALGEEEVDAVRLEGIVRRRLEGANPMHAVWLWEAGGEVVSLSGHGSLTPTGIRIGPVYTPPDLRGKGFATALVAAQSQWLLDQGRRCCFLYTDLSNPTSNAIYRRIGYVLAAESVECSFRLSPDA